MSDELTRAIGEALGCVPCPRRTVAEGEPMTYCRTHDGTYNRDEGWPCADVVKVAAALAPLIEARVREARADALAEVADVLDASTAKFDRAVGGPTEPTRFVRDTARNLRNDAEEVRRG